MGDRITFVGDSHGQAPWLGYVIRQAAAAGSHQLVQVGDFGLWPGQGGKVFLDKVAEHLEQRDSQLVFIDGNHDWHERRLALEPEDDGLVTLHPRLRYVPRGTVWEFAPDIRAFAVGGAPSIDRDLRTQGVDWWPEETLSCDEIERCLDAGRVDVMVSHDCPSEVHLGLAPWGPGDQHRAVLSNIWRSARPRWGFSGHYHMRRSQVIADAGTGLATRWEVLDCDQSTNSGRGWVTVDSDVFALSGDDPRIEPPPGEPRKTIELAG